MFCLGPLPTRTLLRRGAAALGLVLGAARVWGTGPILPEPPPDPAIPGFRFPESEPTLTGWITDMARGAPFPAAGRDEAPPSRPQRRLRPRTRVRV